MANWQPFMAPGVRKKGSIPALVKNYHKADGQHCNHSIYI